MKEEDVNQPIRIIIPVPPRRFADGGENRPRLWSIVRVYGTPRPRQVGFRFIARPVTPPCFMAFYYMYVPFSSHARWLIIQNQLHATDVRCSTFCVLSVTRSPLFPSRIFFSDVSTPHLHCRLHALFVHAANALAFCYWWLYLSPVLESNVLSRVLSMKAWMVFNCILF